ncbi:transposable element tc1 transposase [Plakobranchus ocellatus]|uniref:Transposable element tc1 transposase n=1 Tax=Plakobranchus ocellatus TaxID=259542 RepID=A0AAV3ZFY2_9GAST|nr:transposable element tc1 transposase [Plakobranchus ocellatus]
MATHLPRSGRSRIITLAEDLLMPMQHLCNRFLAVQTTAENFQGPRNISRDSVPRRLREVGLHPHRPAIRSRLTQMHRRNKLQWAMRNRRWTNILWSNESFFFVVERRAGRLRVYQLC